MRATNGGASSWSLVNRGKPAIGFDHLRSLVFILHIVSPIRLSLAFVNSPGRESVPESVVSLLPTVTTPFSVGVPVKHQQPSSVIIKILP